jgi:hypothetical protein
VRGHDLIVEARCDAARSAVVHGPGPPSSGSSPTKRLPRVEPCV